jgi:hypothetical protein
VDEEFVERGMPTGGFLGQIVRHVGRPDEQPDE